MNKPKSKKKTWLYVIGILVLVILYVGMMLVNHTAILADLYESKENYLCLDDYSLRYIDDIDERVHGYPMKFFWKNDNCYDFGYDEPVYQTSRGVHNGMTWEEFLEVYGDYYADSIYVGDNNYETEHTDEWYDSHYIDKDMTPNQYVKNYVEPGTVVLDENASVSIDYCIFVKGNRIAFSDTQESRMSSDTYGSSWPTRGIFNLGMQVYTLSFHFGWEEGKMILYSIGSYKYTY